MYNYKESVNIKLEGILESFEHSRVQEQENPLK
jgi:hypothetical protein